MRTFYVIATSWEDVLSEVVGWSENYYIASTYYKYYIDTESEFLSYSCENLLVFSRILLENHNLPMDRITDLNLLGQSAQDGKVYMIYQSIYQGLFQPQAIVMITNSIGVNRAYLSMAPLTKYLLDEKETVIETIFVAYQYFVSMNQCIDTVIDPVYLLRYLVEYSSPGVLTSVNSGCYDFAAKAVFITNDM